MSAPILVKVYGNIFPASQDFLAALQMALASAHPDNISSPPATLDGDLLLISFEGIYFPEEEVVDAIKVSLRPEQSGKLDILDLENWVLRRHVFEDGKIITKCSPLNNVLDYSGH